MNPSNPTSLKTTSDDDDNDDDDDDDDDDCKRSQRLGICKYRKNS